MSSPRPNSRTGGPGAITDPSVPRRRSGLAARFLRRRRAALAPVANDEQLALARDVLAEADVVHGDAFLALTGDKRFIFSESGRSFLMFGASGRAWVALGEPVGKAGERGEVEASFIERARSVRATPSFYAVGDEAARRLAGLGFVAEKVGERAVIDLPTFTLSGKGKKDLRWARNQAEKAGCRFEVRPPGPLADLETPLRRVSEQWLAGRGGREKRFSLGRFDPGYLEHFSLAIMWRGEDPVAFANIRTHAGLVTLDLMRFADDGPGGGMDPLFTELALWARGQGYLQLDLGLAPLAGLDDLERPTTVSRLGALIYARGGRFYGFEGLRAFKDKFDPCWEPAYIAAPSSWHAAAAAVAVASLTGGGLREILRRTRYNSSPAG